MSNNSSFSEWWESSWLHTIIFIRSKLESIVDSLDSIQNATPHSMPQKDYSYEIKSIKEDIERLDNRLGLDLSKLSERVTSLEGKVDSIQRTNSSVHTQNTNSDAYYRGEILRLEQTIADRDRLYQDAFQKQQTKIDELTRVIQEVLKKGSKDREVHTYVQEPTVVHAPKEAVVVDVPKVNSTACDNLFAIVGNESRCILGERTNKASVRAYIDRALDVSKMLSVIDGCPDSSLAIYVPILKQFQKGLTVATNRFFSDYWYDDDDVESLSEDVTTMVHNKVSSSIIENVITSISRKLNHADDTKYLREFLKCVNEYLSSLGYYTSNVEVGENILERMANNEIDVVPERCKEDRLYGVVKEVERLPYYINCYSSNSPLICRGVCTVYTNKI